MSRNMFGAPPLMYWHSRQWHCALSVVLAFGHVEHLAAIASTFEFHGILPLSSSGLSKTSPEDPVA
jgi:hypothetical protein